jgi:molecular chaperone HscB
MSESPFDVLGLPPRFEIDLAVLEARVRDLQRALHPDRHANGTPAERRVAMSRAVSVNEAFRTLRDDLTRAAALLDGASDKPADPDFLMEIMELREGLSDAREAGSIDRVRTLALDVRARAAAARATLATALDVAHDRTKAADALAKLRYYRRFLDEVEVAEEDARTANRS